MLSLMVRDLYRKGHRNIIRAKKWGLPYMSGLTHIWMQRDCGITYRVCKGPSQESQGSAKVLARSPSIEDANRIWTHIPNPRGISNCQLLSKKDLVFSREVSLKYKQHLMTSSTASIRQPIQNELSSALVFPDSHFKIYPLLVLYQLQFCGVWIFICVCLSVCLSI